MSRNPISHRVLPLLPVEPADWTFVAVADCLDQQTLTHIAEYGFSVDVAGELDAVEPLARGRRTLILARSTWLAGQDAPLLRLLGRLSAAGGETHLLVLTHPDEPDEAAWVRQLGALLTLHTPLDIPQLLLELSGLAWAPRSPYRVLLVAANTAARERHGALLTQAGCRVQALASAPTDWSTLAEFAPEACVFEVEQVAPSRLGIFGSNPAMQPPVLYLGSDEEEEDAHPLFSATAVLARARWFRRQKWATEPELGDIPPPMAQPPRRFRILVADDHPANQAVLRAQLVTLGHEWIGAPDGLAALNIWQEQGCDLLLADLNMPGLNGLALARTLRAAEPTAGPRLPIIAITALDQPEDAAACLEAGMDDVLTKPIELEPLRRQLDRWLPSCAAIPGVHRSNAAVLDLEHLRRVIGDADQWQELVALFVRVAREDLAACRGLLTEEDGAGLGLFFHRLKSSARMVGALHCAVLAERLAAEARTGQREDVASRLDVLSAALDEVEEAGRHIAPRTDTAHPPGTTAEISSADLLEGLRLDEFSVHFQPRLDSKTRLAVSAEAVLVWQRNGHLEAPARFLAAAQALGLAGHLWEVLLTKALLDGVRLIRAGFPLAIALPLPESELTNPRLPAFLLASLITTGYPAESLILELNTSTPAALNFLTTWQALIGVPGPWRGRNPDAPDAPPTLAQPAALPGCSISPIAPDGSTDDMASWAALPVAEFRLDQDLLRIASDRPAARAILLAGMAYAQALQIPCVAAGIDNQAQLDLLQGLESHLEARGSHASKGTTVFPLLLLHPHANRLLAQGDQLAAAMPLTELISWLRG